MPFPVSQPTDEVDLIELFTEAKLAQVAPILHQWYAADELRTQFREAMRGSVERVFSDDLAALFRQHARVPGVETDDAYKNRVLDVPHLGTVLAGIRFRALDLSRPFVDVVAHTAPLLDAAGLLEATTFLRKQFAPFAPRHVQFFVPAGRVLDEGGFPSGTHWDDHVIAGLLATLRAQPAPRDLDRVALRVPTDLGFYSRYVQEFEALYAQRPQHRDFARIEAEEDLAEYLEQGLLFEVEVDGTWAGVVAATRSTEHGMRGFVVIEMFLDAAHRGGGLGPAVGRQLIEHLPAQVGDVLYGTIHHENVAARRSGLHGGREDIGAFFWVSTLD